MIRFEDCKREPCYTHLDLTTGVETHIAATQLDKWLRAVRAPCLHSIELTEALVDHVAVANNVEQHRLDRITLNDLEHPIIVGVWEDTKQTVFDGNHRIVAGYRTFAKRYLPGFVVPPEVWRHFQIGDFPDHEWDCMTTEQRHRVLRTIFSGIS